MASKSAGGLTDMGLYGLGVMGQNLALNVAEKGFNISVSNRSEKKVDTCVERCIEYRGQSVGLEVVQMTVGFNDGCVEAGYAAALGRVHGSLGNAGARSMAQMTRALALSKDITRDALS